MPLYDVVEDSEFPKARIFPRAIDFQHWLQDWRGMNHLVTIEIKNYPTIFPCACIISYKDTMSLLYEITIKCFPIGVEVKTKPKVNVDKYTLGVLPTLDAIPLCNIKIAQFSSDAPNEAEIASAWVNTPSLEEILGV